ncbi:MAG: hypothetical protein LUH63_09965 [Parabacteroides sp.]|nr:hypothetical protein [Parabacteroides sp.]
MKTLKKRRSDYQRSYKKIKKEIREASDPQLEMILYALFLAEEANRKQERMCAVARSFLDEYGAELRCMLFGEEKDCGRRRIQVTKPEFLIGIFKTLWLLDIFKWVQALELIRFACEAFDFGLAESSVRTIWYDKCGMYDRLTPVLQDFFRNLYKK